MKRKMKRKSSAPIQWRKTSAISAELGVDGEKVRNWIRSGELVAVDVATVVGGRPRWRISPTELEAFLKRRQSQPAAPSPRPRRRRKPTAVHEFF
jgi:hypothetical protein